MDHFIKTSRIVEIARDFCAMLLERDGGFPAQIHVHLTDGTSTTFPYKTGDVPAGVEQAAISAVIRIMHGTGVFAGAVMMSEAWMSQGEAKNAALAQVLRPSQDPDRKEVVVVQVLAANGDTDAGFWNIDRSSGKPRLGERIETKYDRHESWLFDVIRGGS